MARADRSVRPCKLSHPTRSPPSSKAGPFELHDSLPDSYYWFGQQPNGAVFFHPLGLRYAPMSVWINASGDLMGRGAWSSYPQIRKNEGFAELARFVGQDHLGPASGFPIAEHDVEILWAHILGCAQKINRAS